jgi:hypothetical protein
MTLDIATPLVTAQGGAKSTPRAERRARGRAACESRASNGQVGVLPAHPGNRGRRRLPSEPESDEIRVGRAQLKKELATGAVRIEEVLVLPPDLARTERVSVLLLAVPKYGRVRVSRLLTRARISDSKTLDGLSDRQRAELIAHFRS